MTPSLWAQYVTELRGGTTKFIEFPWGFISYSFPQWAHDCVLVEDCYVLPEQRRTGNGKQLFEAVERVGRKAGKSALLAHLELTSKVYEQSMRAQLAVGLVPISANNDKILLRKTL